LFYVIIIMWPTANLSMKQGIFGHGTEYVACSADAEGSPMSSTTIVLTISPGRLLSSVLIAAEVVRERFASERHCLSRDI